MGTESQANSIAGDAIPGVCASGFETSLTLVVFVLLLVLSLGLLRGDLLSLSVR